MITKEMLKDYANKLMFDMNDEEYDTLLGEFAVILKQMDLIENISGIKEIEPMTFPFELEEIILREDDDIRNITIEDALSNCEATHDREIKVPKVVE